MVKTRIITYFIATVWLANGLFCKVLNLAPRHQQIVARIIGDSHAGLITRLIGIAETVMAIWVFSGWRPRLNAMTQMAIIAAMNTLEFFLAPDLLLWGRFNALFAFLFILLIYYNEFLKNHPFPVEAFFESSVVLTFAAPKEQVQSLIPECLELDVFDDQWAFIAVAMVQTKGLRPKGFPKALGNDFFLIGYRVFVRHTDQRGKRLRGLYIIKSETDKKKMEFFGNIFTHYNYTTTDIRVAGEGDVVEISSKSSDLRLRIDGSGEENIALPNGSPFRDWKEARRFAGPLPFTFTYDRMRKEVLIIEGVREEWKPAPARVMDHHFGFIDGLRMDLTLANAFVIRNIPYYWKKGKIEPWKPKEEISRAS